LLGLAGTSISHAQTGASGSDIWLGLLSAEQVQKPRELVREYDEKMISGGLDEENLSRFLGERAAALQAFEQQLPADSPLRKFLQESERAKQVDQPHRLFDPEFEAWREERLARIADAADPELEVERLRQKFARYQEILAQGHPEGPELLTRFLTRGTELEAELGGPLPTAGTIETAFEWVSDAWIENEHSKAIAALEAEVEALARGTPAEFLVIPGFSDFEALDEDAADGELAKTAAQHARELRKLLDAQWENSPPRRRSLLLNNLGVAFCLSGDRHRATHYLHEAARAIDSAPWQTYPLTATDEVSLYYNLRTMCGFSKGPLSVPVARFPEHPKGFSPPLLDSVLEMPWPDFYRWLGDDFPSSHPAVASSFIRSRVWHASRDEYAETRILAEDFLERHGNAVSDEARVVALTIAALSAERLADNDTARVYCERIETLLVAMFPEEYAARSSSDSACRKAAPAFASEPPPKPFEALPDPYAFLPPDIQARVPAAVKDLATGTMIQAALRGGPIGPVDKFAALYEPADLQAAAAMYLDWVWTQAGGADYKGAWLLNYWPAVVETLGEFAENTQDYVRRNLGALSFQEQLLFLSEEVPFISSLILSVGTQGAPLKEMYQYPLNWKGLLVRAAATQSASIRRASADDTHRVKVDRLREVRDEISALQVAGGAADDARIASLTEEKESLERSINATYGRGGRLQEMVSIDALRGVLGDGEVFVDLHRFDRYEDTVFRSTEYAAVVLTSSGLALAPLGDANEIDRSLRAWFSHVSGGPAAAEPDVASAWAALRQHVWEPIAAILPEGWRQVSLAPDSELSRIPWQLFGEDQRIVQVDSGWHLYHARTSPPAAQPVTALLVGDVDFGIGRLAELPGTALELNIIETLLDRADAGVLSFRAAGADEASVAGALEAASWAHFATHGIFATAPAARASTRSFMPSGRAAGERAEALQRNPLMTSGLALSGFNGLGTERFDGFLSAEEILGIDLSGMRFFVLSACNTGRGLQLTGQGVMGLRSAISAAGAANTLMSLWSIDDRATVLFMQYLYEALITDAMAPPEALKSAQQRLRQRSEFVHPYFWAGWALVSASTHH